MRATFKTVLKPYSKKTRRLAPVSEAIVLCRARSSDTSLVHPGGFTSLHRVLVSDGDSLTRLCVAGQLTVTGEPLQNNQKLPPGYEMSRACVLSLLMFVSLYTNKSYCI